MRHLSFATVIFDIFSIVRKKIATNSAVMDPQLWKSFHRCSRKILGFPAEL